MLVIDANVVIAACLAADGFEPLGREELVAPHLMWSEASSAMHEMLWRREISEELGQIALKCLGAAPVKAEAPRNLVREAWRVADRFGWAKTYDAEYVALARSHQCRLLTLDSRLARRVSEFVEVVGPADL